MTPLEGARLWLRDNYWPIPVPYSEKRAIIDAWQNLRLREEDLPNYFSEKKSNVSVLLGEPEGNADVDLDCLEAIAVWKELGLTTKRIFGRPSKRASHHFYRSWPPVCIVKYEDAGKVTLVELRGLTKNGTVGLQTVVPPSVHPSGEPISFEPGCDSEPAAVDGRILQFAVAKTAAAALLARHWPAEQAGRHDAFLALAGMLARAGWTFEDAQKFHRAIYRALWPANPDFRAADLEVETSFHQFANGGEVTGFPTLAEKIGDPKVLAKVTQWLQIKPSGGRGGYTASAEDVWPDPEPLGEVLPPVLPFDEGLLPDALRPLVVDIAERMQVPIDYPATAVMLCLAGAVNRRAIVQPKDGDSSWSVVPNLWGAVIGPPGYLKTPALQALTRILDRIQADWRAEHADAKRLYTQDREKFDLRITAWKEEFKKGREEGPHNA